MNSSLGILFAFIVLASFVFFFLKILIRIRRGGGSLPYFISSGTMDATLDREKKEAVKIIIESNAHKRIEAQSSSDPHEK